MFVRNRSHQNDVSAFIALMSEKTVVIHKSGTAWFVYPGRRQAEGSYAFYVEEEDYEPLLAMLKSCNKDVTINE